MHTCAESQERSAKGSNFKEDDRAFPIQELLVYATVSSLRSLSTTISLLAASPLMIHFWCRSKFLRSSILIFLKFSLLCNMIFAIYLLSIRKIFFLSLFPIFQTICSATSLFFKIYILLNFFYVMSESYPATVA